MGDSLRRRATRIGAGPIAGEKELRMRFPRAREFWCPTVSERVLIRLARPRGFHHGKQGNAQLASPGRPSLLGKAQSSAKRRKLVG